MEINSNIEERINYKFKNKSLLKEALTHSSCTNEGKSKYNNERLEFLGDSVLSVIVTEFLFKRYNKLPEGELTKIRASLVCTHSLVGFANKIELGKSLYLGKGEENSGGRTRQSILEDAFEALIGAIYLDGGLEEARKFVLNFIPETIDINKNNVNSDYKTTLQEIIQQNREEKIQYVLIGESGPDHDKNFDVEVHLNSNVIGKGSGKSKKQAEQMAAKQALELMGHET